MAYTVKFSIGDYVVGATSHLHFKVIDYATHEPSNQTCYIFQGVDSQLYVLSVRDMEDGRFVLKPKTERVG